MAYHNDTCGCADCANYGQTFNPQAIHNQSCGCPACGNYSHAAANPLPSGVAVSPAVTIRAPVALVDAGRATVTISGPHDNFDPGASQSAVEKMPLGQGDGPPAKHELDVSGGQRVED